MENKIQIEYRNPLWDLSSEIISDFGLFPTREEAQEDMERCKKEIAHRLQCEEVEEVKWHLCPYCGSPHARLGHLRTHLRYCKSKPKDVPHA